MLSEASTSGYWSAGDHTATMHIPITLLQPPIIFGHCWSGNVVGRFFTSKTLTSEIIGLPHARAERSEITFNDVRVHIVWEHGSFEWKRQRENARWPGGPLYRSLIALFSIPSGDLIRK